MRRIASIMAAVALLAGGSGAQAATTTPVEVDAREPRVSISPLRYEATTGRPGTPLRFPLTIANRTPDDVTIRLRALPLAGSSDPTSLVAPAGRDSRSAAAVSWVAFEHAAPVELASGTQLVTVVTVLVPANARPGTYAIGFAVSQRVSRAGIGAPDTPQSNVVLDADLVTTAVVRVPGEVAAEARIHSVAGPRLVWAGSTPVWEARIENVGDTDLRLDAELNLSAFLGAAGRTLETREQFVLPDGQRRIRLRWTDPPLLGWFQPELVVVGGAGSGVRITDELPTVWVLPPWWLVLVLLLAVALPLWARRRRRRTPAWQAQRAARIKARIETRERTAAAKRRAAQQRRRR